MRIGLDAMGGDRAPVAEVRGAVAAREHLGEGDRIVLVGRRDAITEQLRGAEGWQDYIEIRHAEQVIRMDDSPVEALRAKPDSSLAVVTQLHKAGEVDACISAGNTGAFVAAAQMNLRRLPCVHRPGIAVLTPTFHGPVAICDVGANVSCRPSHLYQYGLMASIYVQSIHRVENPRVGLLSVGEEDAKGNELVKKTRQLLRKDPNVNFIGNVEGRDLFNGSCDVMICDGFVGNVVLKLIEGMAQSVIKGLLHEVATKMPAAAKMVEMGARSLAERWDFNEYGGAPLLGVNGICIICHGASSDVGIKNAVRSAKNFAATRVNEQITNLLSQASEVADG